MGVFSKYQTIDATCVDYVHPWTQSCADGSCSLFFHAVQHSGRLYFTVYMLSLLMHRRIPSPQKLKNTLLGIVQSTAFLTANAFGYSLSLCFLRAIMGNFNFMTISYVPSFIASLVAILVERPSRRSLLTLYVTNVASETLFRMAVWRKMVKPIPYGDVMIFAVSIASVLYMYRKGHNSKDAIFSMLRVAIGPHEEHGSANSDSPASVSNRPPKAKGPLFESLERFLAPYYKLLNSFKRHPTCPHPSSCVSYTLKGGLKMFAVGYGLQFCMRVLLRAKRLMKNPSQIPGMLIDRKMLSLGLFLGGFPAIFRTVSCALRWIRNKDSPSHAIPAGFLAGLAFVSYRDNSVALYAFWKLMEVLYTRAVGQGLLPDLPGAGVFLYCASTALLFHAAIWEPQNLRPSYWDFLQGISGGRISCMSRDVLECFGLESKKNLEALLRKNKTDITKFKF
ncbi:Transmembrane protein 135 [Frankliniella fusca]|uniref:Transmembrane protein 135 n=1 Tax=Frankliniella fusca TaxID=407009 RepID=A0AAE1LRT5_9NEOP|nr:Transmembrane protein 135 [Frankliniella fusca]